MTHLIKETGGHLVFEPGGHLVKYAHPCADCDPVLKASYTVVVSGLSGVLAGGNGTFVMPYDSGCRWATWPEAAPPYPEPELMFLGGDRWIVAFWDDFDTGIHLIGSTDQCTILGAYGYSASDCWCDEEDTVCESSTGATAWVTET